MKRVVIALLVGFFVLNVSVVGVIGWHVYEIVALVKRIDLVQAETHLGQVEHLTSLLSWTSLGVWRLPGASHYWQLWGQGLDAARAAVTAGNVGHTVLTDMVQGNSISQERFEQLAAALQSLEQSVTKLPIPTRYQPQFLQLQQLTRLAQALPTITGVDGVKTYVVLFQNNMELRPTGGFLGSYALVTFASGALRNVSIQDIYAPDGQIKGYVPEPDPIKAYLFNGDHPGWRLRDSNWDPDFPKAAVAMQWFFGEGGIKPIDGMIAITLFPVVDTLAVVGPVSVPDYQLSIGADTFYAEAQARAETNFFPGSTQKKDFLGAVGNALLQRVMNDAEILPRLLPVLWQNLEKKQVQIALFDERAAGIMRELSWDGSLKPVVCTGSGCVADYIAINEANLGINKTNCCVDRQVSDAVTIAEDGTLSHRLAITYQNHNPATPQPPVFWGGGYKNYLRIFIPKDSSVSAVIRNQTVLSTSDYTIESVDDKTVVGLLSQVEGGTTGSVTLEYTLGQKLTNTSTAQLTVQKQSGIATLPYILTVTDQRNRKQEAPRILSIDKDSVITVP